MTCSIKTIWSSSKIRNLCDVSRGSSPRPIADQRYFEGGNIPWIKIADATKSEKFLNRTRFLGHYLSLKLLVLSIDDVCIPQGS